MARESGGERGAAGVVGEEDGVRGRRVGKG